MAREFRVLVLVAPRLDPPHALSTAWPPLSARSVSVRLGDWDAANDPDCHDTLCAPAALDVAIEEKVVHEGYRRGVSDIALLRLARPVAFSGRYLHRECQKEKPSTVHYVITIYYHQNI